MKKKEQGRQKTAKGSKVNMTEASKETRQFETMSQQENRHGKGRERSGSDGGSDYGNFSNR